MGRLLGFLLYLVLIVLSFFIQIILHELGHLVFGLISGYHFVSFRIGSVTLVKDGGKIRRKKFTIRGTGGQCLMMPPESDGYHCPCRLYNLGGVLMNGITAVLCLALYIMFPGLRPLRIFWLAMFFCGLFQAITNGFPMSSSGLVNDGYNAENLAKDPQSRYAFYTQLRVNGLLHQGVRLKDMPLAWFQVSEQDGQDRTSYLRVALRLFEAQYYHDKREFDRAEDCYLKILKDYPDLLEVYRYEIRCELLFYELIGPCRPEEIHRLYTEELKKYIRSTRCYISRERLLYAYALFAEKDSKKAEEQLKQVFKTAKTYPVKAEVESELELIGWLQEHSPAETSGL
ncbi:M50 family metallopeptidase [Anaerolentibacter hominis]|uniref:M50 family metallopeptidase n=1 Tax=Anaerolentibacter hominis TaxID=3079009 RepID=UPI0031B891FE